MTDHVVVLRLNQQQFELVDRTVKRGEAKSREELVRRALAEHASKHLLKSPNSDSEGETDNHG
jgi:hypothetical protein